MVVSFIAIGVFIAQKLLETFTQDREKLEKIRNVAERMKAGENVDEEEIVRATTEMNKILVRRLVFSIVLLIPILWVMGLGTIDTPLGKMGAIWWYVISYMAISGGVAIGSALQKAVKKD